MKPRIVFVLLMVAVGLFATLAFGPTAFARLTNADQAAAACECGGSCVCEDCACTCENCDGNCTQCDACCNAAVADRESCCSVIRQCCVEKRYCCG